MSLFRFIVSSVLLSALLACSSASGASFRHQAPTYDELSELRQLVLEAAVHVDGGTGIPFYSDGTKTYILTAAHVVDYSPETIPWVTAYKDGSFTTRPGFVFFLDNSVDYAIIACPDLKCSTLPLEMSYDSEVRDGDLLIAAGWPGSRPAITSIGNVREKNYYEGERGPMLYHSASGWFGYSGGPVVLARTGTVVGVTIEIRGERGVWDSTRMIAVPIKITLDAVFKVMPHGRGN